MLPVPGFRIRVLLSAGDSLRLTTADGLRVYDGVRGLAQVTIERDRCAVGRPGGIESWCPLYGAYASVRDGAERRTLDRRQRPSAGRSSGPCCSRRRRWSSTRRWFRALRRGSKEPASSTAPTSRAGWERPGRAASVAASPDANGRERQPGTVARVDRARPASSGDLHVTTEMRRDTVRLCASRGGGPRPPARRPVDPPVDSGPTG